MKYTGIVVALAFVPALALSQGPGYGPGEGWGPGYGPGMGRGMMRGHAGVEALNLSAEQSEKIAAIREETRRKNWGAMGEVRSEMYKLQRLYSADKVDPNAVVEQQKRVDDLRRQMLRSRLEARNRIEAVLTPEQRQQFRQLGPWWMRGEGGE